MNTLENEKKTNKLPYIILLMVIGTFAVAILNVIFFLFRCYFILGTRSMAQAAIWVFSVSVLVAIISMLSGGLVGLITGVLKVNIPNGLFIGLIVSLFYSTIEMLFFMDTSNIPVRNAFFVSAITAGAISHLIAGATLAGMKNKFKIGQEDKLLIN